MKIMYKLLSNEYIISDTSTSNKSSLHSEVPLKVRDNAANILCSTFIKCWFNVINNCLSNSSVWIGNALIYAAKRLFIGAFYLFSIYQDFSFKVAVWIANNVKNACV